MPTMPLNQLALPFPRPALPIAEMDGACCLLRSEEGHPRSTSGFALKRNFPTTRIRFVNVAWLDFHCTFRSLVRQPNGAIAFVLQLRNGLGTVPENDSTSLQRRAAPGTRSCFSRRRSIPLVLQHSQCVCRSLRRHANGRRL